LKITITVEIDEESVEFIKTPFGKLSDKINTLISMFEKVDYVIDNPVEEAKDLAAKDLAEIESIIEEPSGKPIVQKGAVRAAILQEVKKSNRGITSEKLQQKTGYTGKQISNNMFHLKKANLVKKTKSGRFVAV